MGILDDLYGLNAQPPALFNDQTGFSPGLLGNVALGLISAGTTPQRVPQSSLNTILGGVAQGVTNYGNQLVLNRQMKQQNLTDYLQMQKTGLEMKELEQNVSKANLENKLLNSLIGGNNLGTGQEGSLPNKPGDINPLMAIIYPDYVKAQIENKKNQIDDLRYKEKPEQETDIAESKKIAENRRLLRDSIGINYKTGVNTVNTIDSLLSNKSFDRLFGQMGGDTWANLKRKVIKPGSEFANAVTLLDTIKGKTFLVGFDSLKGGGTITEKEGDEAKAAIGNLDLNQGAGNARKVLSDIRNLVADGVDMSIETSGFSNLPKGAVPIGASGNDYNVNVYRFGRKLVQAPKEAIYQGIDEAGNFIFLHNNQKITVKPTPSIFDAEPTPGLKTNTNGDKSTQKFGELPFPPTQNQ